MPIAPLLQRFVDDELALAPQLIERTLTGTLQLLRDAKDRAPATERAPQLALIDALQSRRQAYQQAFVAALARNVRDALQEQQGGPASEERSFGGLELMDESRVEIDIEISRAMQVIDTTAEWQLRELQTFTSTLVGQTHVSAESNPFRPQICASALWQAACAASDIPAQRTTLLRVSSGVAAGLFKNAWAAACSRLEDQGVEPGIYRSVVLPSGSVPGRSPAAPNATGAIATLLASMPGGSAGMQVGVGNAAYAMGSPAPRASAAASPEFEQALARLDELLRHAPAAGSTTEAASAAHRQVGEGRAGLLASAGSAIDRQIIELMSRVFDAMLTDPDVPAPFAPVIARLRASALRVALGDVELFVGTQHPVWRLLDRIGEAAFAHPLPTDSRNATLLALCQALAESLANAPRPDAALYRRALGNLDKLLGDQMQAQLAAARPAAQALQRAEQRELLEQQLAQRLADQMTSVRTTATVRRFMTGAWARVLAASIQNEGEQGETTRGYIKLVDELLWSVQLPDHPQSRQRLITLLPSMLARLRGGARLINLPATEEQAVLDDLIAIHSEALRPSGRASSSALSAEQIVQQMRDEVLPAATGHGGFSDSVIDLASMATVPAEFLPTSPDAGPVPAERVQALRPGDRLRLFLNGRWSRVQLLWRSEQGRFLLFSGENPARNHSITRRAIERLAAAGLMLPLESRPLVQRALDLVTREANRLTPA